MHRRLMWAVGLIAVLALVASACGGKSTSGAGASGSPSTATSPAPSGSPNEFGATLDPTIAGEVPPDIKSKGTLTVAADATYAPNEFIPPGTNTVSGMDVDLGHAIGTVLGLNFNFVNASFDTIIPGLAAGKYDIGMSSFTDTKEREKVVDFVTYFSAGTSFYVSASGGPNIGSLADLCGHKVGVEKGTTQQDDATAQAKKCASAGKAAVTVDIFPDQNGANLALSSGRVDVVMADSPVAAYAVKQSNGQFKLSGQPYGTAPYGIAIPRPSGTASGSAPMSKPILDALQKLMSEGIYTKILDKWGVQDGAISSPTINGATS